MSLVRQRQAGDRSRDADRFVSDQRRILYIARGSLVETEYWMIRAEKRRLLERGSTERLNEIARTLNGLIKKHGRP